jgi:hypothetical protein
VGVIVSVGIVVGVKGKAVGLMVAVGVIVMVGVIVDAAVML